MQRGGEQSQAAAQILKVGLGISDPLHNFEALRHDLRRRLEHNVLGLTLSSEPCGFCHVTAAQKLLRRPPFSRNLIDRHVMRFNELTRPVVGLALLASAGPRHPIHPSGSVS